jgi:hypothetical protein
MIALISVFGTLGYIVLGWVVGMIAAASLRHHDIDWGWFWITFSLWPAYLAAVLLLALFETLVFMAQFGFRHIKLASLTRKGIRLLDPSKHG